jgi:hypothetical protein
MNGRKVVWIIILPGLLYWILDSLADSLIFGEGTFISRLLFVPTHEIYMRLSTIAVAMLTDSFDSVTADRPYRPSPGKEYAASEFKRCCGTQFDPCVVEAFLRVLNRPER